MKTLIKTLAVSMLLLPLSISAEVEISPVTSISEIMAGIVTPHSDALWAAGAKAYDDVADPSASIDEATWESLEASRLTLAEVAQALLLTTRPVEANRAATRDREKELSPEQIAALIAAQPDDWASSVGILAEALAQMKQPIADRDVGALATTGDVLYEACAGCHQGFWYPPK